MTHLCPTCGEPCECSEDECAHCDGEPAELDFEGEPDEEWIERLHGGGDD